MAILLNLILSTTVGGGGGKTEKALTTNEEGGQPVSMNENTTGRSFFGQRAVLSLLLLVGMHGIFI
jgi:hypothetical protein